MVGKSVVFLLVEAKRLLCIAFLHTRHQLVVFFRIAIRPMNGEEILLMAYVLLVSCAKITLAKRKVIDGIEDVGLACPIQTHKTIDILRKQHVCRLAVLKVGQFEFMKIHWGQNLLRSNLMLKKCGEPTMLFLDNA